MANITKFELCVRPTCPNLTLHTTALCQTMTLTDDQADYRCTTETAGQPKPTPSMFEAVKAIQETFKKWSGKGPYNSWDSFEEEWRVLISACYKAYEAEVARRNGGGVNIAPELNRALSRAATAAEQKSGLTAYQRRLGLRSTKYLSSTPANMDYD